MTSHFGRASTHLPRTIVRTLPFHLLMRTILSMSDELSEELQAFRLRQVSAICGGRRAEMALWLGLSRRAIRRLVHRLAPDVALETRSRGLFASSVVK